MNILFIADVSIADVIGGAERVLFEQSTRLAKRGHNVHLLTRKLPDHKTSHADIQGVNEWRYDTGPVKNAVSFIKSTCVNGKALFNSLQRKHRFSCLNLHQPFSSWAVLQSPLSDYPQKIYTCHSLSPEEFLSRNPTPEGLIKKRLHALLAEGHRRIEKMVLNRSDQIVVLSKYTENKLVYSYDIPPRKIQTIPGGIDLIKFRPAPDKDAIRSRLDIPPDRVILFTVRNLVQRMGFENLLKALELIAEKTPDIYLAIGGEGPLKEKLLALTSELGLDNHVVFKGFIPEAQLPAYYQMADLFVLPTKELEGFGLVTLEAMASGLPVIGTAVGGTKEIIGQFDSGLLFSGTDPESMAALMLATYARIKEQPREWEKMSRKCRQFTEDNYGWEKNVDGLESLFIDPHNPIGITNNLNKTECVNPAG